MSQVPGAPRLQSLRDPVLLLALGFGTGLSPRAPGTVGSVLGIGLYALVLQLPVVLGVAAVVLAVAAGVAICGAAARRLGCHDHPAIVWDEIACVPIALATAPAGIAWVAGAFVLFRALDAAKPWPIAVLDRRVPGGAGIMADDLAAAAATALIVHGAALLAGAA